MTTQSSMTPKLKHAYEQFLRTERLGCASQLYHAYKPLGNITVLQGLLPSPGVKPKHIHLKQVAADVGVDMNPRQQGYKI